MLADYHLRYLRSVGLLSTRIAFTDSTLEQATLRGLLTGSLLIGFVALAVLFACSYVLSGAVTRPVARAWQQQKQFLSDASHELKTPLTVVLSSAELLDQSALPEQKQYVDNIRAESRRMKRLVEDMLTLSRVERSGAHLPDAAADLSDIAADAALRFEPVAFEAGHTLSYDIAPDLTVLRRWPSCWTTPSNTPRPTRRSGWTPCGRAGTPVYRWRTRAQTSPPTSCLISSTGSIGPTSPVPAATASAWDCPSPRPSRRPTTAPSAATAAAVSPALPSPSPASRENRKAKPCLTPFSAAAR